MTGKLDLRRIRGRVVQINLNFNRKHYFLDIPWCAISNLALLMKKHRSMILSQKSQQPFERKEENEPKLKKTRQNQRSGLCSLFFFIFHFWTIMSFWGNGRSTRTSIGLFWSNVWEKCILYTRPTKIF